jgi:leader peptidase (prepilin peptidase) / N-methyltransferase
MTTRHFRLRRLANPALMLAAALVVIAAAWITAPLWNPEDAAASRRFVAPEPAEAVRMRGMLAVMGAWFFFFGASVGSFLNVVVWRLPRGETLIWRPSRCPRCGARIRASDNLPVFGWLKLRGKCRACRMPISRRYPAVEFVAGAVFLMLAVLELFAGGVNLPAAAGERYTSLAWYAFELRWTQVALYAYHCLLASILLSWALIDHDRKRVPAGYVAFALFVGVLAPMVATAIARLVEGEAVAWSPPRLLHPVPVFAGAGERFASWGWLRVAIEPLAGLAAGATLGLLLRPAASGAGRRAPLIAAMALVGAFLGWQAAASVALLGSFFYFAAARRPQRLDAWPAGWLFLATLVHLALWRWLDAWRFWPGAGMGLGAAAVAAIVAAALAWLAARIAEPRRRFAPL